MYVIYMYFINIILEYIKNFKFLILFLIKKVKILICIYIILKRLSIAKRYINFDRKIT